MNERKWNRGEVRESRERKGFKGKEREREDICVLRGSIRGV